MDHRIHHVNYHPLSQLTTTKGKEKKTSSTSFQELLLKQQVQNETSSLKISKHAQKRLAERNIQLDQNVWETIEAKVNEAKKLGVSDSLVITDEAALVVSAKNNTVITAMNRQEASTQIFTNINGTILI